MTDKKVELLSPAGDYECFLQAINNGADAVYLAGQRFGARAYAGNFEHDEIIKALDYAHINNKKIYLTVNTVFKQNETEQLYEFIRPLYENGLDGVIVQDIGALSLMKKMFPDIELHGSTQMSVTDSSGVNLLKEMGVSRVVPARELSLKEIKGIIKETGIEVETFIHGAMCYSYSGKCLISSFLGGRSGNRGRCAQPCRLMYNKAYPLSMKDMYTLPIVPELIKSGIASFKIEGRMKSREYVACVTGIYRKYIDMYYNYPDKYSVDKRDETIILDAYTRSGNCQGYYKQYNGKNMITISEPGYNGKKTSEDEVKKYTDKLCPKLQIEGYAYFEKGKKCLLTLNYEDIYVTVDGDEVEEAVSKVTGKDVIIKQLSKTGGTCFEMMQCSVSGADNLFVPISKLNELRRKGIELLYEEILRKHRRYNSVNYEPEYSNSDSGESVPVICATCQNKDMFYNLLDNDKLQEIIVPASLLLNALDFDGNKCTNGNLFKKIENCSLHNRRIILALPNVIRDNTRHIAEKAIQLSKIVKIGGFLVSNLESLQMIRKSEFAGDIITDEHIYCTNRESVNVLKEKGVSYETFPVELDKKELSGLNITDGYYIVYGKTQLMISAGCVRKTLSGCEHKEGFYHLTDRKNADFSVLTKCSECTNILYNSVPVYIEPDNDVIKELKPSRLRIDFTDESIAEADQVLKHYIDGVELNLKKYTRGHLNKGVE